MRNYHWVWLTWASAFLIPWVVLFAGNPARRHMMWWTSLATAATGFAEPLFVPAYWNPPSMFNLARLTGFDIESFIFAFAVGGIATVLYDALARNTLVSVGDAERWKRRHRFHRLALLTPYVAFIILNLLRWNPIYPAIAALFAGAMTSALCRPDLAHKLVVGGVLFLALYSVAMSGLQVFAPGYIPQVWRLAALSGVLIGGVPLEELLFGLSFGLYWTSVYEHFTWHHGVRRAS